MQLIYQRGGSVANSKFDFSLLKPVDENGQEFNTDQLTPVEDQPEQDAGAYLDSLPKQQEGYFHLPRSILAGLTNLGRDLHNAPHDLALGAENSINNVGDYLSKLTGKNIHFKNPHALSDVLPSDETNYANVFGQQGEGTLLDRLVQKGVEHAPEIYGAAGIARAGLRALPPMTQFQGARRLRAADQIINDLNANVPLSPQLINESRAYLPNTHATREMITNAESGHYPSSFSTQSQVGYHERNLRTSPLASERLLAPHARELKENMLGEMENALRSQSHIDPRYTQAADFLRGGINDYRQYIQFRDTVWPLLKRLGIPTTALALTAFGIKKGTKAISNLNN